MPTLYAQVYSQGMDLYVYGDLVVIWQSPEKYMVFRYRGRVE